MRLSWMLPRLVAEIIDGSLKCGVDSVYKSIVYICVVAC